MAESINISNKGKHIFGIIILIVSAILLYGFFAGFRANFGMITTLLCESIPTVTYGEVNTLFFIFTIVNGLGTPLMGYLTIKKSNLFVLLLGCIFVALGMVGIAISSSLVTLAIAIGFFLPLGSAALSYAVIFSLVSPCLGMKAAAIAAGVINCSSTFFAMLLAPVIEVLTQTIGLSMCIMLFAAVAIIFIPLSIFMARKEKKDVSIDNSKKGLNFIKVCKKIFQSKSFYIVLGCYFLYGFCCQGITNHLFAGLRLSGVSGISSSYLLSIANLSMTLGMLAIGFIAAKFRKHISIAVIIVFSIAFLETFACFLEDIPLIGTILLVVLCILGGSILPLASLIASESIEPVYVATSLGILHFTGKISQGLNFQIGGIISDITGNVWNVCIAQAIGAVFIAIFIVLCVISLRKKSIADLYDKEK